MKCIEDFQKQVSGYNGWLQTKLATLDDVKKLPELKGFDDQEKELGKALKISTDAFVTSAEKYVSFWQQQADHHLEKNGDEVKRAAYQT